MLRTAILSSVAGLLLGSSGPLALELRKGGALLLDAAAPAVGAATMRWVVTPRLLRALGAGS